MSILGWRPCDEMCCCLHQPTITVELGAISFQQLAQMVRKPRKHNRWHSMMVHCTYCPNACLSRPSNKISKACLTRAARTAMVFLCLGKSTSCER